MSCFVFLFFGLPFHKYFLDTSDELGIVLGGNQAKQARSLHSGRRRETINKILKYKVFGLQQSNNINTQYEQPSESSHRLTLW